MNTHTLLTVQVTIQLNIVAQAAATGQAVRLRMPAHTACFGLKP